MSSPSEKIVLDLETKKSFNEVESRKLELLGVSVVGIYSFKEDQFYNFLEKELKQLLSYLQRAELVIGFNVKRFDYPVLQPYLDLNLKAIPTLDILEEVQKHLGFRVGLDNIAQATLKIGKLVSGLDALQYFRQGNWDKLTQYCQHDVFLTRQLYEYGRKHGYLLYFRGSGLDTIPVGWGEGQPAPGTL